MLVRHRTLPIRLCLPWEHDTPLSRGMAGYEHRCLFSSRTVSTACVSVCDVTLSSLDNPNLVLSQVIQSVHQAVNLPIGGLNLAFEDRLGVW